MRPGTRRQRATASHSPAASIWPPHSLSSNAMPHGPRDHLGAAPIPGLFVPRICARRATRKPIRQTIIELHPTRRDLAVHNFVCADCGPVRTKIISLRPRVPTPNRSNHGAAQLNSSGKCLSSWICGSFIPFGTAAPAAWRSSPSSAAPRRASADLVAERCNAAICPDRGRSGSARLALETTLMDPKRPLAGCHHGAECDLAS